MNYKVMKRPMFRLGGGVIKGKQVGNRENFQNPTPTYNSLIKDILSDYSQSQQRAKDYGTGVRNILGASVLASAPTLSSIRSLSDVPQVLSEIGSSPQLFNALLKSRSLDLKAQEKDLDSKMKMAKLLKPQSAFGEKVYDKKKRDLANINDTIAKVRAKDPKADITALEEQKRLILSGLETEASIKAAIIDAYFAENEDMPSRDYVNKMYQKRLEALKPGGAEGGRVGYQEGTPEPMMQETISVEETLNPVKEQPQESSMSVKQMYDLMRQRIPQANVSDKDLYKIASSEQIMADFASLETMSDVTQFNEQYDTNIVLDLPIVG